MLEKKCHFQFLRLATAGDTQISKLTIKKKKCSKNSPALWSNCNSEIVPFQILCSNSKTLIMIHNCNKFGWIINRSRYCWRIVSFYLPQTQISSTFLSAWVKWEKLQFIFPEARVAYFPVSFLFSFYYFKNCDHSQYCCVARSEFWWLIIFMAWCFTKTVSKTVFTHI